MATRKPTARNDRSGTLDLARINGLAALAERDLDLLMFEELEVNPQFRTWFVAQMGLETYAALSYERAWHSLVDAGLGQSDLVVRVTDGTKRVGILIENKIDATFTDRQPERYRQRGQEGQTRGWWSEFRTCLLAPEKYLSACRDAPFDVRLSYEKIAEWFEARASDPRQAFKARMLREAIEHAKRGYTLVPDEAVTEFIEHYWRLARAEFPKLRLQQPGEKGKKSAWVYFQVADLPKGAKLVHKMEHGECVDLQFSRLRADTLEEVCGSLLDPDMRIEQAGRSAVIRIDAPRLDRARPFAEQERAARAGLTTAQRLLAFCNLHRKVFYDLTERE